MTLTIPLWLLVSISVALYLFIGLITWNLVSQLASGPRGLIKNPGKKLSPFLWVIGYPLCVVALIFLKRP